MPSKFRNICAGLPLGKAERQEKETMLLKQLRFNQSDSNICATTSLPLSFVPFSVVQLLNYCIKHN